MLGRVSVSTWDGSAGCSQSEYGIHSEHITVGPGSEHACGCYVEFFTGWAVVPDTGGVLAGVVVPDGGGAASGTAASATGSGNAEKVLQPESKGKQIQWGRPGLQEEHGLQGRAVSETLSIVCRSLHCERVELYRVEGQRKEEVMHHDRLQQCEDRAIPFWVQRKRHGTGLEASQEAAVEGPPSSDLDETVAYGQNLPQDVKLALEEKDPEWNLDMFFQEEEERPRGGSTEEARLFKGLCGVVKYLTLTCTYCSKVFGPWVAPKCWAGPLEEADRRMPLMELWIDGASCNIEAQGFKILESAVWVWSCALGPPSYHSTVFRNVFYLLPGQLEM